MTEVCPDAMTKVLLKLGDTAISLSANKDNCFIESMFSENTCVSIYNCLQLKQKILLN